MASGSAGIDLWNQLSTLTAVGAVGDVSDGQLLQRLGTAGDATAQGIFTVLVERHGPMVLSVCRQVLRDPHDAQDAFQATFLVLARKAGSIRKTESAASWLYGVALRIAVRARADAGRRRIYEQRAAAMKGEAVGGADHPAGSWPELHEEIGRLPAHYREPFVLCYLEGLSTEVAAERLGCPRGTVLSRLSRAREQLRGRLTRRGLAVPSALLAASLAPRAATAALPPALVDSTVRASLQFAGRRAAETGLASAAAATMARGALHAMTLLKLKTLGAALVACALAAGGVQALAQLDGSGETGQPARDQENPQALSRKLEALQAQLDEATRTNKALRKQLEDIRAELQAERNSRPKTERRPRQIPAPVVPIESAVPAVPAIPGIPAQPAAEPAVTAQSAQSAQPIQPVQPAQPAQPAVPATPARPAVPSSPSEPLEPVKPADPAGPVRSISYRRGLLILSPTGDRVVAYNTETGAARSLPPLGTKEEPVTVLPVLGPRAAALILKGPKITRLAAAAEDGSWHTQDLRQPVKVASPIVGNDVVVYALGRYLYAFSPFSGRWAVQELPDPIQTSSILAGDGVRVEVGGHIYTFSSRSAGWTDLDLNSILDRPEDAPRPAPRVGFDGQPRRAIGSPPGDQ